MDDIDDARELSDDEVNLFLDSYYKDTHTLLLESRIFALEAKLEGVRARLSEAEERSNVD